MRPILICATIAFAALLTATGATAAPAREERPASIQFELPANHGLRATVEAGNGEATLEISDKAHLVSYKVQAESTESGLRARFGELGEIDVGFKPTKTRTDEPPPGCSGIPGSQSEGVFTGTIEFTGERRYVRLDTARAKGTLSVWRESEWHCPRHRDRAEDSAEDEPATLSVYGRSCICFFAAYSYAERGRRQSTFVGARSEEREGMEIGRATIAETGASAFLFDHAAGTARVHPPSPFTGGATFKRRARGRDHWRSTIRVPLLGAAPLEFSGRAFRVRLIRDLPGD